MSPTGPLSTTSTHWDARLWGVLLTVSTVIGLDALDVSMVGVALPSIRADLGLSTSALQWVVSGYVLGYGGLLLLGGRAADLLGRRRVFLVAVTVFALASLLGGLVDSGTLLIASRFIKGLAAAFTAPAALSIITTTFKEGPARNRAISIFAVFGASGYSAGLVFSGLLTQVGWRWTFLLPVPIALAALAFGYRLIPAYQRDRGRGYDLPGAVTGALGALLLVFAVVEAPQIGWGSPRTLISFVVAAALLVGFVFIEKRSPHPLLRLGILRSGPLARANLGGALFFGPYIGFQFVVMLYLQSVLHWSALQTALGFLPAALIVAIGSPRIEPLIDRIGTPRTILAGVVAHVLAYLLFLRVDEHSGYAGSVLPSMILLGIGFTLAFSSLNIQATTGISDEEQGLAGGLLNTSLQVGGAIGLAITTAVLTANGGEDASAAALLTGLRPTLIVVAALATIGLLIALSGVIRLRRQEEPEPAVAASSVDEMV
ncbi:MFS transporter [Amycolatopsis sp. GM8]|uniref:MFS transporter n=1 Tax=Amycolatopsis sp. GM8 TaxID=2896530 RepID=UPI001F48AF7C|nr:MFS transporter [Amycolatopsis sp. GM8]